MMTTTKRILGWEHGLTWRIINTPIKMIKYATHNTTKKNTTHVYDNIIVMTYSLMKTKFIDKENHFLSIHQD